MDERQSDAGPLADRLRDLEDFLEYLPSGLLEVRFPAAQLVRMNRMARILTGSSEADLAGGMLATDLLDAADVGRVLDLHRRLASDSIVEGGSYQRTGTQDIHEVTMRRRDGARFIAEAEGSYVLDAAQQPIGVRVLFRDISLRRAAEDERRAQLASLQQSLADAGQPLGLIPVCASCHRVEDGGLGWVSGDEFLRRRYHAETADSLCPECEARALPSP